jgi:hypothetical protein
MSGLRIDGEQVCECVDQDYVPCGLCDPEDGIDYGDGENEDGCSAPLCVSCGRTTNQIQ